MKTLVKPTWIKAPRVELGGFAARGLVVSPYFPRAGGAQKTTMLLKCNILGYGFNSTGINIQLIASDASINALLQMPITVAYSDTDVTVRAGVQTAIAAYCTGVFGIQAPDSYDWYITTPSDLVAALGTITAPNSYQTIVSQSSTTAPAVAGGLAPLNTYPSGTTFAWARTSAGVYTLTASAAVFNTSGKTTVILGPLNNLNGQNTAVVTSSTVITITTAVQSLAFLGLLGFTATPTDAMMTKMAVQVLTYA